ncbi:hypothetical protein M9H77_22073 [Catharanthus roseus]|uniref:Uncharacterized protein n=1 Tax=Catharanthus roseus TaxID=4058 RepID=A0ACC0AR67_CATRO|nr:hypothetical protein M9H77_22073 [Catharanthus roseus]
MLRQIHTTKPQSLLAGYHPILSKMNSGTLSYSSNYRAHEMIHLLSASDNSDKAGKNLSSGICFRNALRNCPLIRAKSYSSANSPKVGEENEKTLPWLATSRARDPSKSEKMVTNKTSRSSWEESADKFLKGGGRYEGNRGFQGVDTRPLDHRVRDDSVEEEEEEATETENIDDPRWDKIKNRVKRIVEVKPGSDRPEIRKWNKQENWGKRTWKEGTESTVPKVVGEGIYGVGPVLAALSAGRREFYTLYIQDGLDLSGNNKKKKDKKGFEKVLRMADKIGLSKKHVSKHDLNMVVDNRPHQGLVLDASPLEMVGIKELEPVSVDEEGSPLWMALDEVTDPQNLGAIIRSAYFFGASGVVLCAKNSAPLSGVVSKASAGSLELMELRSCKNMMQFLTSSAKNGWRVLGGSVSSRAVSLNEVPAGAPSILVLGSEGTGLRPLVERSCTQLIKIPGNTPLSLISGEDEDVESDEVVGPGFPDQEFRSFLAVESLNVSVAAGVLLHHLTGSKYSNSGPSTEAH